MLSAGVKENETSTVQVAAQMNFIKLKVMFIAVKSTSKLYVI